MCIYHKKSVLSAVFFACILIATDSVALPERICVKAAENTRHYNIPGTDKDDNIKLTIDFPLHNAPDASYGTKLYTLGLHQQAHCWDTADAMAYIQKHYPHSDHVSFASGKQVILNIRYGKDSNLGECCDIEPYTTNVYMVDRQNWNVIDYWWSREYKCPVILDDGSLAGHLYNYSKKLDLSGEGCYEGMSYAELILITWETAPVPLIMIAGVITLVALMCRHRSIERSRRLDRLV